MEEKLNKGRDHFNCMSSAKRELLHVLSAAERLVHSRNPLLAICVLLVTVIIVAGLWPFDFFPANGANWLSQKRGVRFSHYGIGYSKDALVLSPPDSAAEPVQPLSIEILLKPYEETAGYIARIVVLSRDLEEAPLLTIGQWRSFFLVRTPRQANEADGEVDEIGVKGALRPGEKRFVTLTAGPRGATIYLDGARAEDFPSHRLSSNAGGKTSFRLVLGNDTVGKSPWHGEILGLAIYDRELRPEDVRLHYEQWGEGNYSALTGGRGVVGVYTFDEGSGPWVHNRVADSGRLWIPDLFRPLQREILASPGRGFKLERYFVEDVIVNVLGFVPLGYFLMGLLLAYPGPSSTRPMWLGLVVVAVGTGLSLFIELLQVYLPTRDSSLVDVISNTAGTALGVLFFHLTTGRWISPQRRRERGEGF